MVRFVLAAAMLLAGAGVQADPPHARPRPPVRSADDQTLEQLALRLAERLGAQQSADGDGSLVMRVRARAPVAPPATAPKPSGKAPVDCVP